MLGGFKVSPIRKIVKVTGSVKPLYAKLNEKLVTMGINPLREPVIKWHKVTGQTYESNC
jgi:hypothetical protein